MSDPIDQLRSLTTSGVDVDPLPAAEVRRRGDRRRRRTHALATVGGVVAVAAVVAPLALGVRGAERSAPPPAGPASSSTTRADTEWRQRIPADVDLTALPAAATFSYTARDAAVIDDLTLCGVPVFSPASGDPVAPAVDTAGAEYADPGTENSLARTLALYADDELAGDALAAIESGVRSCPLERQDPGLPLVHQPVDTELASDDSFVFTQQARLEDGSLADLTVVQVARIGNALYLADVHTSAGGPQVVDAEVRRLAELSAPVISDLCVVFSGQGC